MRRLSLKVLLPVFCVVAMLTCTMGSLTVSANTTSVSSVYDLNGDGVVTAWDIIEKDGYLEGVWYPWFTHTYLGSSLAQNPDLENMDNPSLGANSDYWQNLNAVGIDGLGEDQIKMEIFNLKALGFNVMAYMGSPWGEGTVHNTTTWEVTGVRSEYLTNMRRLLNICREVGMPVLWYIHCHSSVVPSYINLDAWYRITQVYSNPAYSESYAENFVRPVCEVLAEYRDVVVMVGLTDELENETNDSNMGGHFAQGDRETYGVTQEAAAYFQGCIGRMVKDVMPDMPTTYASNKNEYAMYADSELDFVGRNQYSSSSNVTDMSTGWPVGPMLATEYGIGDGSSGMDEDLWSDTLQEKRDNFLAYGYSGFFHWAYSETLKTTAAGGNQFHKQGATTLYDFRKGMYEAYYYSEAKYAELGDGSHVTGKPSAMYHDGAGSNGKIYWLQPQGVTSYTVQRSVDGGSTWINISGTVAIDSTTGSYRYCMTDPNPPTSGAVQYRITANGHTSYTNEWAY